MGFVGSLTQEGVGGGCRLSSLIVAFWFAYLLLSSFIGGFCCAYLLCFNGDATFFEYLVAFFVFFVIFCDYSLFVGVFFPFLLRSWSPPLAVATHITVSNGILVESRSNPGRILVASWSNPGRIEVESRSKIKSKIESKIVSSLSTMEVDQPGPGGGEEGNGGKKLSKASA